MTACQQAGRHLSLSQEGCSACGWTRPWRPIRTSEEPVRRSRGKKKL